MLDQPISMPAYGALAAVGALDDLGTARQGRPDALGEIEGLPFDAQLVGRDDVRGFRRLGLVVQVAAKLILREADDGVGIDDVLLSGRDPDRSRLARTRLRATLRRRHGR